MIGGPARPPLGLARGWQRARRWSLEQALDIRTYGLPEAPGPTLVVANHAGALDEDVLTHCWPTPLTRLAAATALRAGRPGLAFPEGGASPDGTLGAFRPAAFEPVVAAWRAGRPATVTPAAIIGTFGVGRQLPWWRGAAERPVVVVRAGAPIGEGDTTPALLPERARDAVAALLAEDAGTWWEERSGTAAADDAPSPGWRGAWTGGEPRARRGARPPRRIWG